MCSSDLQRPLATVVIGGVLVATLLSRLLLPIAMEYLLKNLHPDLPDLEVEPSVNSEDTKRESPEVQEKKKSHPKKKEKHTQVDID